MQAGPPVKLAPCQPISCKPATASHDPIQKATRTPTSPSNPVSISIDCACAHLLPGLSQRVIHPARHLASAAALRRSLPSPGRRQPRSPAEPSRSRKLLSAGAEPLVRCPPAGGRARVVGAARGARAAGAVGASLLGSPAGASRRAGPEVLDATVAGGGIGLPVGARVAPPEELGVQLARAALVAQAPQRVGERDEPGHAQQRDGPADS
mgnify:CR=1 FL=1